jgi:hypothetical protein
MVLYEMQGRVQWYKTFSNIREKLVFIPDKPFQPSLWARLEPSRVKHQKWTPLLGRQPALLKNIRLGWKGT